jgi:hypothetical protein
LSDWPKRITPPASSGDIPDPIFFETEMSFVYYIENMSEESFEPFTVILEAQNMLASKLFPWDGVNVKMFGIGVSWKCENICSLIVWDWVCKKNLPWVVNKLGQSAK